MQTIEGGLRRTSVNQVYDHLATMVIIVNPHDRELRCQKARFRGFKPSELRRRKRKGQFLVPSSSDQMDCGAYTPYHLYLWQDEHWDRVFEELVSERYASMCEENLKKEENFLYHSNKKRIRRFGKDKQKKKKNRARKRG